MSKAELEATYLYRHDQLGAHRDEQAERYAKIGEAVMRKFTSWLPGREPIHALRDDAQRVAFDLGECLCTIVADTIADALEKEQA